MRHQISSILKKVNRRNIVLSLPFLFIILLSILTLQGGLFHPETRTFFDNYLSHRPFFVKIFDAERYRQTAYQAREFSYIFDFIDTHFILFSMRLGLVHFYSLTHYAASFIITILTVLISRHYFGQKYIAVSFLLGALFLTNPSVYLGTHYYRSSKILVSLFITLIVFILLRYAKNKAKSITSPLLLFIFGFLLSVSDKQGSFFIFAFAAIAFFIFLIDRKLKSFTTFLALLTACGVYILYSDIIGPQLIKHFGGQYPDSYATTMRFASLYEAMLVNVPYATQYVAYQFGYFFGNIGWVWGEILGITLIFALGFLLLKPRVTSQSMLRNFLDNKLLFFVPFLLLLSIPMVELTFIWSLDFLTWPDLRILYYPLPILTIIFIFVQLFFSRLLFIFPKIKKFVLIFLTILLTLNIIAIPTHYNTLQNGHLKDHYRVSGYLRHCIKEQDKDQNQQFAYLLTQQADEMCGIFRQEVRGETKCNRTGSDTRFCLQP